MRTPPDMANESDANEVNRMNAEDWMIAQLALNPSYVHWGPHEDYMIVKGDGWGSSQSRPSWSEFDWQLDELNECVNFYFEVVRDSQECERCRGNGYEPDAQWISESFYQHSSPFKAPTHQERQSMALLDSFGGRTRSEPSLGYAGFPSAETLAKYGPAFRAFCEEMRAVKSWNDRITQDEVDALQESHRVGSKWDPETKSYAKTPITAAEVNASQSKRGFGSHDGINRMILIRARCKRLGAPIECISCEGRGETFTSPAAHLQLVLWMIHPRKGASRGVEVLKIEREDLPKVYAWLRLADERNHARFAKIP